MPYCNGFCEDCPREEKCQVKEAIEDNIYFGLNGCDAPGVAKLPETFFRFIGDIAGMCTDKSETPDYYNNPRAMFVALDLIYKACQEVNEQVEAEKVKKALRNNPVEEGKTE